MKPSELFKKALTYPVHETDDIHYIGEALPAPSNPAAVLSLGTPAHPGGSAVPAREDHVHALDLQELIDAINADPMIDLSNYYTIAQVDALIAGITVDLSDYYTITEVDTLLSFFYTSAQIDAQPREIIWSYNSIVKPTTTYAGQRWPAPYDLQINALILTLQSSSSVDYTIKVYVAGVLVRTTVFANGSVTQTDTFTEAVTSGDIIYITIDTAPTGTGVNLAAILRFERV